VTVRSRHAVYFSVIGFMIPAEFAYRRKLIFENRSDSRPTR
jgi:hypothetical protein